MCCISFPITQSGHSKTKFNIAQNAKTGSTTHPKYLFAIENDHQKCNNFWHCGLLLVSTILIRSTVFKPVWVLELHSRYSTAPTSSAKCFAFQKDNYKTKQISFNQTSLIMILFSKDVLLRNYFDKGCQATTYFWVGNGTLSHLSQPLILVTIIT